MSEVIDDLSDYSGVARAFNKFQVLVGQIGWMGSVMHSCMCIFFRLTVQMNSLACYLNAEISS